MSIEYAEISRSIWFTSEKTELIFAPMFLKMLIQLIPDAEEIAPFVQEDQLFLILYKELYYRHIYARVQGGPTIEQRFENENEIPLKPDLLQLNC